MSYSILSSGRMHRRARNEKRPFAFFFHIQSVVYHYVHIPWKYLNYLFNTFSEFQCSGSFRGRCKSTASSISTLSQENGVTMSIRRSRWRLRGGRSCRVTTRLDLLVNKASIAILITGSSYMLNSAHHVAQGSILPVSKAFQLFLCKRE